MRKTMIIPTYWCRKTGDPWQEGDAVYDHPTPVDQEGTLERTLVSMKQFHEKDFKLVILICPTTPEVETAAYEQVLRIVVRAQLNAETYLFTAGDLREITEILRKAGLNDRGVQLLSMFGYSNVRNICLLAASTLTADAALLIDDDEVFELPDFVPRSLEFLGRRVYGDIVHGVAGYYLNSKGQYYCAISPETMSFIVPPVKLLLRRSWASCSRPLITAAPTSTMRCFTPEKRENCIRSLSTQYSIPICPCQPQNSGRPLNPLFLSRWAAPAVFRSCRQSTVSLPQ